MEYCCADGEHIRTACWLASPHHSTLSHSHQHYHSQQASMSFDDSSSCMDNVLGMIHGESSTILPSHYKVSARTPTSRPWGCQTPKPPHTSGFPHQSATPTITFNVNGYKLCRGDRFLPILFSLRSVDELRARPFTMIGSRTFICRTLFMLGR